MIEFEEKQKVNILIEEAKKSYITKEEFINIINTLEFGAIKNAEINFITGFIYDKKDEAVRPLSKRIEIN